MIARDEGDRIADTVRALREAFPGARVIVADDGSSDDTPRRARTGGRGARAVRDPGRQGRRRDAGGAPGAVGGGADERVFVLCDGDLGSSPRSSGRSWPPSRRGGATSRWRCSRRGVGGGFGVAVGFARWAIRSLTGLELQAPISGQRAMRGRPCAGCCRSRAGSAWRSG